MDNIFFQAKHYSESVKCAERINYILLFYNDVHVDVPLWYENMKSSKCTSVMNVVDEGRLTVLSAELFIDMLLIITFCPCRALLGRVAQELGISFATSGSVSFRCKTRKFLDELSYCARNRRSVSKGRRKHNRRKMPFSVLV